MKGDGVVGETPIIEPLGVFKNIIAFVILKLKWGKMNGFFSMQRLVDKSYFDVVIPEFMMVLPAKLN